MFLALFSLFPLGCCVNSSAWLIPLICKVEIITNYFKLKCEVAPAPLWQTKCHQMMRLYFRVGEASNVWLWFPPRPPSLHSAAPCYETTLALSALLLISAQAPESSSRYVHLQFNLSFCCTVLCVCDGLRSVHVFWARLGSLFRRCLALQPAFYLIDLLSFLQDRRSFQ